MNLKTLLMKNEKFRFSKRKNVDLYKFFKLKKKKTFKHSKFSYKHI